MIVQLNLSALREARWYEYLIRFALGGAMTIIAGLIADHFGPIVGGLFLAFPAIFPASATLVEKHERERKEKIGLAGARRGTSFVPPAGAHRHAAASALWFCGQLLKRDRALGSCRTTRAGCLRSDSHPDEMDSARRASGRRLMKSSHKFTRRFL
jgi:hypothetical protein